MADPRHVRFFNEGVEFWNRWRKTDPIAPALADANLRGPGPEWDIRLLSSKEMSFRSSRHEILLNRRGMNLERAVLVRADLSWNDLSGADLSGAFLLDTNLSGTCLRDADLSRTLISGAFFADTDLSGVKGLDDAFHMGPSSIDYLTLRKSANLPLPFLRGCGLPEGLIQDLPFLLNNASSFWSCFISYAHGDAAFAHRLHDALQGRGIRCWLDEKQLLPGDDIYEQVDRGIRFWDKVLLCCSELSLASWWVDNEIGKAFAKEQSLMKARGEKVLVLIPLNLDGYLFDWQDGKADEVRRRLAADFTGWDVQQGKFERQLERVIQALRADEGGRQVPPLSLL
jgi:uncharacterized protein YjbI with pentapeptide repeats